MKTLHVYSETAQPATRFFDHHMSPPMLFTYSERRLNWCDRCGRRRWMGKLLVQVYYDSNRMFCADRDGCEAARKGKPRRPR